MTSVEPFDGLVFSSGSSEVNFGMGAVIEGSCPPSSPTADLKFVVPALLTRQFKLYCQRLSHGRI